MYDQFNVKPGNQKCMKIVTAPAAEPEGSAFNAIREGDIHVVHRESADREQKDLEVSKQCPKGLFRPF